MADTNHNDPYAFVVDLSRISPSQQQLLHRSPFVGNTLKLSAVSCEFPVVSAAIVVAPPPETQDGGKDSSDPQDVFHTPPEESPSLPSSDDQRRNVAIDRCAVDHAVDVEDGTQQGFVDLCGYSDGAEFVDLGRDSDLGFSEVQLDAELVVDCSRDVRGDGVGEISECQLEEFRVLERELDLKDGDYHLGELPVKKLKLSEENLGFGCSGDCFGVELQKVEEGMGDCEGKVKDRESPCNFGEDLQPEENVLDGEQMHVEAGDKGNYCREVSMEKNLGSGDVDVCEADKLQCMVEGDKSSDEVTEASGMQEKKKGDEDPGLRVLPSSIPGILQNAAKELRSGKGKEEEKRSVFCVLKVLSENTDEVEDSLDNVSLLEAAKLRGVTFPPPRWWPDKDNFKR